MTEGAVKVVDRIASSIADCEQRSSNKQARGRARDQQGQVIVELALALSVRPRDLRIQSCAQVYPQGANDGAHPMKLDGGSVLNSAVPTVDSFLRLIVGYRCLTAGAPPGDNPVEDVGRGRD